MARRASALLGLHAWRRWAGKLLTTEEKISSDMPLPMPRWVMSSPSHMSRAVPAVRVITTTITRKGVKLGSTSRPVVLPPPPKQAAAAVVEEERQAGGLQQGDA